MRLVCDVYATFVFCVFLNMWQDRIEISWKLPVIAMYSYRRQLSRAIKCVTIYLKYGL